KCTISQTDTVYRSTTHFPLFFLISCKNFHKLYNEILTLTKKILRKQSILRGLRAKLEGIFRKNELNRFLSIFKNRASIKKADLKSRPFGENLVAGKDELSNLNELVSDFLKVVEFHNLIT
ncbi:hypothetical protein, partial [Galbibacter sp.]|uniref:hypothetical protein n=1 Tax=Galbibacter sp. TaxID=2918471 RepID=UPI003A8D5CDB